VRSTYSVQALTATVGPKGRDLAAVTCNNMICRESRGMCLCSMSGTWPVHCCLVSRHAPGTQHPATKPATPTAIPALWDTPPQAASTTPRYFYEDDDIETCSPVGTGALYAMRHAKTVMVCSRVQSGTISHGCVQWQTGGPLRIRIEIWLRARGCKLPFPKHGPVESMER
jgi:hypothetical protein